jgi:glutamate-5-semialdehyde dehydrogenase
MGTSSLESKVKRMARKAKAASLRMALVKSAEKNHALKKMARAILDNRDYIVKQNAKDLKAGQESRLSAALMDRLTLNEKRIKGMAQSLMDTARLKDPIGEVMMDFTRPNGLRIKRVRTPIGTVGIIYESRPNVTSDCIGLCLKSGNAAILKGGKEALYSNQAIFKIVQDMLTKTALPVDAVQLINSTDRKAVNILLSLDEYVDLIVPRGGEGLIRFVAEHARMPVIKHYKGICHVYVHDPSDLRKARSICLNAKVQRPGVCNAMETLLVHKKIARKFLPGMADDLQKAGVEIRGCERTREILGKRVKKAKTRDWQEEYLDLILSVKVVDGLPQAIDHINTYGSKHSDAIITTNSKDAQTFLNAVDSACLYVNASTRFTDGYEFGFGAEVGISTDKFHARGPMALEGLTTYKYVILGKGQIKQ